MSERKNVWVVDKTRSWGHLGVLVAPLGIQIIQMSLQWRKIKSTFKKVSVLFALSVLFYIIVDGCNVNIAEFVKWVLFCDCSWVLFESHD